MKRYDKNSPCVKCGNQGADTKFTPSRDIHQGGCFCGHTEACITRICTTCGFAWKEKTLDVD